MNLTKEVTYELNYNGDVHRIYHFVDDILNLRHESIYGETIEGEATTALNIKATNTPHQTITAQLVGERVYIEDENGRKRAELFYFLPDVEVYFKFNYQKGMEFGEWYTEWTMPMSVSPIYKSYASKNKK
ncbi:hypothetical protein [Jeotgalibacillus marinus]|uniref:Uncharacterized protein n=1 Tax=Jeotgalibacillus marinus TaxID=86667 RepID=A0ABV3Q7N1_9BACL